MAFVLDCSVTMAWVFPDEANESTDALRESLIKDSAIVPVLWPIEVGKLRHVVAGSPRMTGRAFVTTLRRCQSTLIQSPVPGCWIQFCR
ncbi:MAG: type II toxin-antitoxin system VapC family toxin [Pseudomonadota bacterium]|nr:type II toxin-antitoxin system VapC family toxin [Pseudomonadota bacterium]